MFWKEEVRKAASPVRGYCVVQVSGGRDLNGSSGDGLSCCGCKQYVSDNLIGNLDKLDLGIEREGRVKSETQRVYGGDIYWDRKPRKRPCEFWSRHAGMEGPRRRLELFRSGTWTGTLG